MTSFRIQSPLQLIKAIVHDDRVVAVASLLSSAHDYATETTLVELADGTHKLRTDGDMVDSAGTEWQVSTAPPIAIADCLSWTTSNRIKQINTDKPICRISRLVLADRSTKWTVEVNRIAMSDSPAEQIASFLCCPTPPTTNAR